MSIKPPNKAQLRKARLKASGDHYWLIPEPPRSFGRLSQQNKANKKLRSRVGKSEFIQMAERIENEPKRIFGRN